MQGNMKRKKELKEQELKYQVYQEEDRWFGFRICPRCFNNNWIWRIENTFNDYGRFHCIDLVIVGQLDQIQYLKTQE